MGNASEKQIAANRANARHSSGPRTARGRAKSRANGLKHGLAAEVLVPEEQRAAYRAALKRWEHETGPSDVVEHHLIRRAAVASVTLDRLDEAREETREQAARDAVKRWERKQQHAARRKAQDLDRDSFGVVAELEATAFGCDWLIRQWVSLDGPLATGDAWNRAQLDHAQRLLGYPAGRPGPDGELPVRLLWLLARVLAPVSIGDLPRTPTEADFPTEPGPARAALRRFVAGEVERLEGLRDEAWEAVEGPERRSVVVRAAAADTSEEGQLRHRYARDADRSHNAAMRLFLCARGKRRQEYLAIAKEARQSGKLPRVPAGGGWWHEVDCEPAPPGFARIDLAASATDPDPAALDLGPEAGPGSTALVGAPADLPASSPDGDEPTAPASPTPSGDGVAPLAPPAGPAPADPGPVAPIGPTAGPDRDRRAGPPLPGATRRNEPISPTGNPGNPGQKSNLENDLRDDAPSGSISGPWRTEPLPAPPDGPEPAVAEADPDGAVRPAGRPPEPAGAPRRNEPISPAVDADDPGRNPNGDRRLRDEPSSGPINAPWRTGPLPGPDRPRRPAADRPPATPRPPDRPARP